MFQYSRIPFVDFAAWIVVGFGGGYLVSRIAPHSLWIFAPVAACWIFTGWRSVRRLRAKR